MLKYLCISHIYALCMYVYVLLSTVVLNSTGADPEGPGRASAPFKIFYIYYYCMKIVFNDV